MKVIFIFYFLMRTGFLKADLIDVENKISAPAPTPTASISIAEPSPKPDQNTEAKPGNKRTSKIKNKKSTNTKSSEAQPVTFESKSLKGTRSEGTIFLQDDVVVTQGDMRMESTQATIYFHPTSNEVKQINASGKVKFFKKNHETGQIIKADAREAVFYNADQKVLLRGEPKIWRGDDLMTGKQISYDLKSGWIKADRVEGIVQPGNQETSEKTLEKTPEKSTEKNREKKPK